MIRRASWLTIVLLALVLAAGAATADREVRVQRLDDGQVQPLIDTPRQCVVGNLNPIAWAVSGWFTGQEEYKYLFNAVECCPVGFNVLYVHMALNFDETMTYPIVIEVYADLEDALWDDVLQCWVPGIEDCVSEAVSFTIDAPGSYDIAVPMTGCECAWVHDPTGAPYWYMMSLHFLNLFDARVLTDDFPLGCYSWNNWGSGWYDLVLDVGFPGELIMWADVDCCEFPIAVEEKTWGQIKGLYR